MYAVKILKVEKVTHNVKRFVVEKPKGYKFLPGQATEVAINLPGWEEKKRPFTFTSLNSDKFLEFTIKGYPLKEYPNHTGVTEKLHQLKAGDEILIDEPWDTISYKGKGVFIAGGAGITPFIAIFKSLEKKNELKGNTLIFSNKTSRDVILKPQLEKWFDKKSLILTLTKEHKKGFAEGRIDRKFLEKKIKNFKQNFYICGPKEMKNDISKVLEELDVKPQSITF